MTMKSYFILIALLVIAQEALSANILFLSGMPSPSHHIFNRVLILGLADKGHNMTFLSPDPPAKAVPNVHYIYMEKVYEVFDGASDGFDLMAFAENTPYQSIMEMPGVFFGACAGVLASKGLDKILDYPNKFFDLVIYDYTFGPCLLPLVAKFNYPPLIAVSAFSNPPFTTDIVGGQKYPSYIPHYTLSYTSDMSFVERLSNSFYYLVDSL